MTYTIEEIKEMFLSDETLGRITQYDAIDVIRELVEEIEYAQNKLGEELGAHPDYRTLRGCVDAYVGWKSGFCRCIEDFKKLGEIK